MLAEKGVYMPSESTMQRVLKEYVVRISGEAELGYLVQHGNPQPTLPQLLTKCDAGIRLICLRS
jgi:hypothetical protein